MLSLYQSEDEPFQVTLSDESFETYELDPPPYTMEVTKKELKQMYYDMVVIRYATLSDGLDWIGRATGMLTTSLR